MANNFIYTHSKLKYLLLPIVLLISGLVLMVETFFLPFMATAEFDQIVYFLDNSAYSLNSILLLAVFGSFFLFGDARKVILTGDKLISRSYFFKKVQVKTADLKYYSIIPCMVFMNKFKAIAMTKEGKLTNIAYLADEQSVSNFKNLIKESGSIPEKKFDQMADELFKSGQIKHNLEKDPMSAVLTVQEILKLSGGNKNDGKGVFTILIISPVVILVLALIVVLITSK